MSETYRIRLIGCVFFARHGALTEEERLGQRFSIDLDLAARSDIPLDADDLRGVEDYGAIYKVLESVVLGRRFRLIEALAAAIGDAILSAHAGIEEAGVTVRKPSVPIEGVLSHAEVVVVRRRSRS